jgi:hypothetical protein
MQSIYLTTLHAPTPSQQPVVVAAGWQSGRAEALGVPVLLGMALDLNLS